MKIVDREVCTLKLTRIYRKVNAIAASCADQTIAGVLNAIIKRLQLRRSVDSIQLSLLIEDILHRDVTIA